VSRIAPVLVAALVACASPPILAGGAPPPEALVAELSFLDAEPNQVMVDLAPEGARPMPFLVDTGTLDCYVTPGSARAMGISVRSSKRSAYRRATRLGVDLDLFVDTRRGDVAARGGKELALLGGAFLSKFVVEFDFARRRVRFLDPGRYRVPESTDDPETAILPLRGSERRPVIEIEVGGVALPVVVATGSQGTLLLAGPSAARASVVEDPEATAGLERLPGAPELRAARAARVRIGPFEERDVPLLVAPGGLPGYGGDSIIGVDLLKRFVVRIDYARRRLWLGEAGED
jgi:predicted aspartyl protease